MGYRIYALLLGGAVVGLFVTPLLFGVAGTVLPAFGWLPNLAESNGFVPLLEDPRVWPAIRLTLQTGLSATLLVFLLTMLCLVCMQRSRMWRWVLASLPPLLAVPHAVDRAVNLTLGEWLGASSNILGGA